MAEPNINLIFYNNESDNYLTEICVFIYKFVYKNIQFDNNKTHFHINSYFSWPHIFKILNKFKLF